MTSDESLEDLEKQYSKNKTESLDDLENSYQEYKIIGSDEDFPAKIIDAHVNESIYLEFALTEGNKVTVEIDRNIDGLTDIYNIFEAVGQQFHGDLRSLIGESVNVQFENEQMRHMLVGDKREIKLDVLDSRKSIDPNNQYVLPDETISATKRHMRYLRGETKILRCDVVSAYPEDGRLILEFDLLGEIALWSTPVPDGQNMSGSKFESLVEKVGHGSVQQIVEGELYVIEKENIPVLAVDTPNSLGKFENWKNTWIIFPTQTEAEECLESKVGSATAEQREQSAATQTGHNVPRGKVKPFLDELGPEESVQYVGKGGPIKIERGGDVETVTSMSGLERVAITSNRVILKSSQVTGDVYYKLSYDELRGADLKTGILNKKISLRTEYGTYHITIGEPNKESCREMVEFVKKQVR